MIGVTPSVARCIDCNYPLFRIASKRCPECGREFDPEHPGTMNLVGRPIGRIERFILRPKLWPLNLLAVAATAWTLWLFRWPDEAVHYSAWDESGVWLLWFVLMLVWLGLLGSMLFWIKRRRRIPAPFYSQWAVRWLVFPLIGLACWWLFSSGAGFKLLWAINRPALDRWAKGMLESEQKLSYPDAWAGPFWAKQIYTDGERAGFALTDGAGAWCLVHVSPGASFVEDEFEHWREIGDGWYVAQRNPRVKFAYPPARLALLQTMARDQAMAGKSIKALIASLADDSLENVCGFYGLPQGLERFGDEPRRVREEMTKRQIARTRPDLRALIGLREEAVASLRWAMTSSNPEVRFRAVCVLGQMGPAAWDAVPSLIAAMADVEYPIREAAAYALGEIGAREAAAVLAVALHDPLPWVRYNAAIALRKLNADPKPLMKEIVKALRMTNDLNACIPATTAIALPPVAIRDQGWNGVRQENGFTICELIEFIGEIGPDAAPAIPELLNALRHDSTRAAATLELQKLGSAAVSQLNAAAMADDVDLVIAAAKALGRNVSPRVIDRLVRDYLRDKSDLSNVARQVLINLGPIATPRLSESLNDAVLQRRVAEVLAQSDPARPELYARIIIESMTDAKAGLDRRTNGWTALVPYDGSASPIVGLDPQAFRDHGSISNYEFESLVYSYPNLGAPAIPYLVRAISTRTRTTCVLNTLGGIGEPAVPALAQLIGANDLALRRSACIRLGRLGPRAKAALPELVTALSDYDATLRIEALTAIRLIGPDKWALTRIGAMVDDSDTGVRAAVETILNFTK